MKKKLGFSIFLFLCMIGLGAAAFLLNYDAPDTAERPTDTSSVIVRSQLDLTSSEPTLSSSTPTVESLLESPQVSSAASEVPTAVKADFFVYPLSGEVITAYTKDSLIYSKTYDDWRSHNAIDIKGSFGETVHAAGDGVVIEVYYDELWGNTMVVDHGNGIELTYSGLDQTHYKQGQTVLVNEPLGTLGELPCENLDGVHLHLAAKQDGETIDPLSLIS